jgi:translation initiation factor IF-2
MLNSNHLGHAGGIVLESKLDNRKGVVVTVLIKHGILKNGDIILAGTTHGRVRKMVDDKGQTLTESLPSMPVEIYGFSEVPTSGERFFVMESERLAREVISHRIERIREENTQNQISVSDPFATLLKKEKKEIGIIIRSDTQGTLDAINYSLSKIQHEEIKLHIVQSLVGNVTESDILLAKTKGATIFAFNVSVGSNEENLARKNNIIIREHSIIYKIIDEIKALLSDSLSPIQIETKIGSASVRQIFDISKSGKIAGVLVIDGVVKRNALAKVIRNGTIIAQGNIKTLKHFQEDVKSIQQGKECGLQIEKFEGFLEKDIIDIYEITFEQSKID